MFSVMIVQATNYVWVLTNKSSECNFSYVGIYVLYNFINTIDFFLKKVLSSPPFYNFLSRLKSAFSSAFSMEFFLLTQTSLSPFWYSFHHCGDQTKG